MASSPRASVNELVIRLDFWEERERKGSAVFASVPVTTGNNNITGPPHIAPAVTTAAFLLGTYLVSSSHYIWSPRVRSVSIQQSVLGDPVIWVEGPLSGDGPQPILSAQIHLEPWLSVPGGRRPTAAAYRWEGVWDGAASFIPVHWINSCHCWELTVQFGKIGRVKEVISGGSQEGWGIQSRHQRINTLPCRGNKEIRKAQEAARQNKGSNPRPAFKMLFWTTKPVTAAL